MPAGAAKGERRGGRQKGTPNKCNAEAQKYVERVYAKLKAEKGMTREDISVALLTCGVPAVIQRETQALREYAWGKAYQPGDKVPEEKWQHLAYGNLSIPSETAADARTVN